MFSRIIQRGGMISLLSVSTLLTFACRSRPSGSDPLHSHTKSTDSISRVGLCFSTAGNGYNWAAIMAWMSEVLRQQSSSYDSGTRFNMQCAAGSSSGAAFVSLLAVLGTNSNLFPPSGLNFGDVSQSELKTLADALTFLAFTADLDANAVTVYTDTDAPDVDGILRNPKVNIWKGNYPAHLILLDFGKSMAVAKRLSMNELKLTAPEKFAFHSASDLLNRVSRVNEIEDGMRAFLNAKDEAWEAAQNLIQLTYDEANTKAQTSRPGDLPIADLTNRQRDIYLFSFPDHPIRRLYETKIPDGFLSLTFGTLGFHQSLVDARDAFQRNGFTRFSDLKAYVMGSEQTMKSILSSSALRALPHRESDLRNLNKYVFTSAHKLFPLTQLSIREPDLTPVFSSAVVGDMLQVPEPKAPNSNNLDEFVLNRLRQPNRASGSGLLGAFHAGTTLPYLQSLDHTSADDLFRIQRNLKKGTREFAYMEVAGGFVGADIPLFPLALLASKMRSVDRVVVSTLSRRNDLTHFSYRKMKKYFTRGSSIEAETQDFCRRRQFARNFLETELSDKDALLLPSVVNWDLPYYEENQSRFERTILSRINQALQALSDDIDLFGRPAAAIGGSAYAAARVINSVRRQYFLQKIEKSSADPLNIALDSSSYYFDRSLDRRVWDSIYKNAERDMISGVNVRGVLQYDFDRQQKLHLESFPSGVCPD